MNVCKYCISENKSVLRSFILFLHPEDADYRFNQKGSTGFEDQ